MERLCAPLGEGGLRLFGYFSRGGHRSALGSFMERRNTLKIEISIKLKSRSGAQPQNRQPNHRSVCVGCRGGECGGKDKADRLGGRNCQDGSFVGRSPGTFLDDPKNSSGRKGCWIVWDWLSPSKLMS